MNLTCPRCKIVNAPDAQFCKGCGVAFVAVPTNQRPRVNQNRVAAIFGVLILVFALLSMFGRINTQQSNNFSATATPAPEDEHQNIINRVGIKVTWSRGGFGAVMLGNVWINNISNKSVKDFTVECKIFGASGTQIGTAKQTIYEIVPAKKSKTFENINFGFINSQANSITCDLTDLTVLD